MWLRAHRSLGEVTLIAILHRVRASSRAKHPLLERVHTRPGGLEVPTVDDAGNPVDPGELSQALEVLLGDLLVLIDTLTAGILTLGLRGDIEKSLGGEVPPASGRKDDPAS